MDTKRLVTMMLLSFAIIFGWQLIVAKMYEAHPEWKRPGQANSTTEPSPSTASTATAPSLPPGVTVTTYPTTNASLQNASLRVVSAATQPSTVTLGSTDPSDANPYRMQVELTSTAAAVNSITLNHFKGLDRKSEYAFQQPYPETHALATRSILVNGAALPLSDVQWNLESHDPKSAVFSLDLGLIKLRKIYELTDTKSAGLGYELLVHHEIQNQTQQAVKVQIAFGGPTQPPRESERGPDIQVLGGYDIGYGRVGIDHHMADEFGTKMPTRDMTKGPDNGPLLWAGTSSVYFDAIIRPEPEAGQTQPKFIASVEAQGLNPEAETYEHRVALVFQTNDIAVDPDKTQAFGLEAFFGPRWRKVLNEPHYADFPRKYNETLVMTSGPCGYCTFNWLINGLVGLLSFFHFILRDWGLSIICLVILVRLILHPITKRSQVSMMRMGKLGPEMERLKKKYENDKDELNRQMMQLYKDQGIGAYLGCLPMFLQMPIWIALWSALQSTFELRQAPFLYGVFGHWMSDLSRPDHLFQWNPVHFYLPLIGNTQITGVNVLPVLMGVVMFFQQKFTPQPPSTTPEQEMQKKMMLWMSTLMFPLFLYNGPCGLNLYILTSTTIGIIESKRIRDHIKQKEEEEKAGKIIIDAPKGMKKRREDDDFGSGAKRTTPPKEPKTGFAGWLGQLQKKAEDLQREADRQRGK